MRNIKGQITFVENFFKNYRDAIITGRCDHYAVSEGWYKNGKKIEPADVVEEVDNTIRDMKSLLRVIPTTD